MRCATKIRAGEQGATQWRWKRKLGHGEFKTFQSKVQSFGCEAREPISFRRLATFKGTVVIFSSQYSGVTLKANLCIDLMSRLCYYNYGKTKKTKFVKSSRFLFLFWKSRGILLAQIFSDSYLSPLLWIARAQVCVFIEDYEPSNQNVSASFPFEAPYLRRNKIQIQGVKLACGRSFLSTVEKYHGTKQKWNDTLRKSVAVTLLKCVKLTEKCTFISLCYSPIEMH